MSARLRALPVLVVLLSGLLFASTASAASVKLSVTGSVKAGAPIPFKWSVLGPLMSGSSIVMQQPEGTKHVWQTIIRLHGRGGSGSLRPRGISAHDQYRIAVLRRGAVLSQQVGSTNVFGQVSFQALDEVEQADMEVYATPSNSFTAIGDFGDNETPLKVLPHDSDCTSVTVTFVQGDQTDFWGQDAGNQATVTVVQQSRNPVRLAEPFNQIGTFSANLVLGQSWAIQTSQPDYMHVADDYLNGHALCDSRRPIFNQNT